MSDTAAYTGAVCAFLSFAVYLSFIEASFEPTIDHQFVSIDHLNAITTTDSWADYASLNVWSDTYFPHC